MGSYIQAQQVIFVVDQLSTTLGKARVPNIEDLSNWSISKSMVQLMQPETEKVH
jgi:hypothetical protein